MTPVQVVMLSEDHLRAQRQAERAAKDGPKEYGTLGDLARMAGGPG